MKKRYNVKVKDNQSDWIEDLSLSIDDPEGSARAIITSFNNSLRSHEQPREFVEIIGTINDCAEHDWVKKTAGQSVIRNSGIYDLFFCARCGITGKRAGLSSIIVRDSKYKAKKYSDCAWRE